MARIFAEYSFEPAELELHLCKPNYTIISPLTEAYGEKLTLKLGSISLLDFSLPLKVDVRNQLIDNPNVELIKERFVIRLKYRQFKDYFMVRKITKHHDDSGDYISIEASGMAVQLSDKRITSYKVESKTASQILFDVLSGTTWSVGGVDGSFDLMFRSMEYTGNVLDAISNIADTFGALVIFDSSNRRVNLYNPRTYGRNRGVEIARGKLLKSIELEHDNAEFCTRLYVYGKDGLTINGVNPIGGAYLENYSYFIYPFERDEQGNVIKHSAYGMSDSLAAALIDYAALKNSNQNDYEDYLTQLNDLNSQLLVKNGELSDLYGELNTIFDTLSVINSKGGNPTDTINQKIAKDNQIANKKNEITIIQNFINTINSNILSLHNLLSIENNLTSEQMLELADYVLEGDFTNEYVSDAKQLMDLAFENFKSRIEPQILAKISIVNLFEVYEYQDSSDLDKFTLGEIINIKYEMSNINIKATISELVFDFENRDIQVTISNIVKGKSESDQWTKELNTAVGNSNTYAQQKWAIDIALNQANEVSRIFSDTISAVEHDISAGVNESVTISRRGIIISDSDDPARMLIAQNGVLALSDNYGNNWKTAITPDGILAPRLIGQILMGNNLILTNTAGSVTIDGNGMNVTSMNLTLTRSDNKSRTILSPNDGIKIQNSSNNGSSWNDKLYADTNGDLILENIITRGNITAQGTITGGAFNGSSFNFGTITGSTIQTSASTYPRIVLNSSANLLSAYSTPSRSVNIYSSYNGDAPAIVFDNDSYRTFLQAFANNFSLYAVNGELQLGSNYNVRIYGGGSSGKVIFDNWYTIYNQSNGTSLGSTIDNMNSSIASVWGSISSLSSQVSANNYTIDNILSSLSSLWAKVNSMS